jgi:hypothetical protein
MGVGVPAVQATRLGFADEATGLTAAGTTNADAFQCTGGVNQFSTVTSGAGCILPSAALSAVINNGANAILCYPGTGKQINNGTVTTGSYSVAAGKTAFFITAGLRTIATLST